MSYFVDEDAINTTQAEYDPIFQDCSDLLARHHLWNVKVKLHIAAG